MKEVYGKQVYDSLREVIHPKHTALIIVDMQKDFCYPGGHLDKVGWDISMMREIIPTLARVVDEARKRGVLVIFIQSTSLVGGYSESPSWLYMRVKAGHGAEKLGPYTVEGTWGHELVDELQPKPNEPVVKKHRSSAFVNTNLDLILRANGIESTIITGMATQSCVEATARDALHHDYYVVLLRDCVASQDRELHGYAIKIMSKLMEVVSSEDVSREWALSEQ